MRKLLLGALLIVLILSGCSGSSNKSTGEILSEDKPPHVSVEVDGETYETVLGAYCWVISSKAKEETTECVDTVGPEELLDGKDPIQVKMGEQIKLIVDSTPQPNKIHLIEMKNGIDTEIEVKDTQFIAPVNKGVYVYSYELWWMDEEVENTSNNSAFYAFSIEVK